MKTRLGHILSLVILLGLVAPSALLAAPGPMVAVQPETAEMASVVPERGPVLQSTAEPAIYVIQLAGASLSRYTGDIPGLAATSPAVTGVSRLDAYTPASVAYLDYLAAAQQAWIADAEALLGRPLEIHFQYLAVLNGLAITLTPQEAAQVATLPGVRAVYQDVERELDTDVGPLLMGAPTFWEGEYGFGEHRGEGIIVGMLDTGVNPEHPSFAEVDGDGYEHTNPYGPDVYVGVCDPDDDDYDPTFPCNDKLIGAWNFHPDSPGAWDENSHGSHVGSTIGGNRHDAVFNVGPDTFTRTISGVAPRANVISYLVCYPSCPGTSSVAAVNQAILDGVHVLNYSISGGDSPWTDPVDLAFLDAYAAGIYVSASAGNQGPGAGTVAKTGPWNAAVAASTHSRVIANTVDVTDPTPPPNLEGMAAVPGTGPAITADIEAEIIWAGDVDPANVRGCNAFPAGSFTDAIALIQRGDCTFAIKVGNATDAGAVAVIVYNHVGGPPITMGGLEPTTIPAVFIDQGAGDALAAFVSDNDPTEARINVATSVIVNEAWQDIMAGFSSRGPSQWDLLKPDFTAPGVNILAAAHQGPTAYTFMQGTSMSSPHGAGAAALLIQRYPDWSPAEVKSALALTAWQDLLNDDGVNPATFFAMGSGRIDLGQGALVGLVLDETVENYEAANPFLGGQPRNLNQPSMVDRNCLETCSWTRTVRSALDDEATYDVTVEAPAGMVVTVTPVTFTIGSGETQELEITVEADLDVLPADVWAFAQLHLATSLRADVAEHRLPIAVIPRAAIPVMTLDPAEVSSRQFTDTVATEILTVGNEGTADLEWTVFEGIPPAQRLAPQPATPNTPAPPRAGLSQPVVLSAASPEPISVETNPPTIDAPVSLVLDDGSAENNIGIGGTWEFIFLNRFTPALHEYPFHLEEVHVYFDWAGLTPGDDIIIVVYENTTGGFDPAPGSNLLGAYPTTIQTVGAWNVYELPAPLLMEGPGDVLIGVIALEIPGAAYFPAALDQTASQQRSWAGWWLNSPPPDPPTLPPDDSWTLIDAYFAGNWMIRGYGETTELLVCDAPGAVPWVDVDPLDGIVAPDDMQQVSITFDSTGLPVGEYTANLCLESNDPALPFVVVPLTLKVVSEPSITVDPLELWAQLCPDSTEVLELEICNVGVQPLEWEIVEFTRTLALAGTPAADLPTFYDPGQVAELIGSAVPDTVVPAGPVTIWTYPEAILWDNGPMVTHPGGGFNGADASALQSALTMNTYGFGNQQPLGYRMADDFEITDAAGWNIDTVTFFSYQTATYPDPPPSTITGIYFQIWDGPPWAGGNIIPACGDIADNRLVSTGWTNIYRVLDTALTNTQRPTMAAVGEANCWLPPGTYWLDWATSGSGASGPWAPPITILGQTTTGNAYQYTTDWNPAMDTGTSTPQGLPFVIEGSVGGGYPDIPWLSEDPTSGTLLPGECEIVEVTFDSTGMDPGDYLASLLVLSNDPVNPVVEVEVTMTVWAAPYDADFDWMPEEPLAQTEVTFHGMAEGDELVFAWDFGDGHMGSGQHPTHTYAMADTYTVVMTVSNDCGYEVVTHEITVLPCDAPADVDFAWAPEEPIEGEEVTFTGTATGTAPLAYAWDLGDDTLAEGQEITHTYAAAGVYTVVMTVTNVCGYEVVTYDITIAPAVTMYHVYLPLVAKN